MTSEISSVDISKAISEPNVPKNRYQDKIPCKNGFNLLTYGHDLYPSPLLAQDNHTRVQLKSSGIQGSDYINASFVNVC